MKFSSDIVAIISTISIVTINMVNAQSFSLFNNQNNDGNKPSFHNHFNPYESRMDHIDNCMPLPLPNPLNFDINICGHSSTFFNDGCIRFDRLPYGYSLSICADNSGDNGADGKPMQQQKQLKLPPNCIPFQIPMGYKAILCSKV